MCSAENHRGGLHHRHHTGTALQHKSGLCADIREYTFSVEHFLRRVQVFRERYHRNNIQVNCWTPWKDDGDAHWLLRTLSFMWIRDEEHL